VGVRTDGSYEKMIPEAAKFAGYVRRRAHSSRGEGGEIDNEEVNSTNKDRAYGTSSGGNCKYRLHQSFVDQLKNSTMKHFRLTG
jgi:hypothetical protein